jgi:hypothetical protein
MVHTFDCTLRQFHVQSRVILFIFIKILRVRNPHFFSFLRVRLGSVELTSSVQLPGGSGSMTATDMFYNIQNAAQVQNLGNLPVISSSVVVVGGVLASPSNNLGIILGICIPIGVLRNI